MPRNSKNVRKIFGVVMLTLYGQNGSVTELPMTQAGLDVPRPTDDPDIIGQYVALGLGPQPALADIHPHALTLMRQGRIFEALGLVLGYRVERNDVRQDEYLLGAAFLAHSKPEQAFDVLLCRLSLGQTN